ncbi:MAG: hypothetical protein GC190_08285 [Alphaproteobacteria bacterium]|nr:hypothetical protein [Alphaproteobacteria bacterium]
MSSKFSKTFVFGAMTLQMLAAAPAFADEQKPSHNACPFTDRLRHWTDVDKQTAIIEMGVNRRYKVTFVNDCTEMRYAIYAKVESRPGICLSPGDRITFGPRRGIPSTCVVSSVEELPPGGMTPASTTEPAHSN